MTQTDREKLEATLGFYRQEREKIFAELHGGYMGIFDLAGNLNSALDAIGMFIQEIDHLRQQCKELGDLT